MRKPHGGAVSAGEISRNFGEWQSKAMLTPVTITHHGVPRLILASIEAFESQQTGAPVVGSSAQLGAQFQALLSQMKESFFAIDAEFRVVDVNPPAALYLGLPKEVLVGRDLREAVPGLRNSIAWDFFRQVMRNGEVKEFTTRGELHGQTRVRFRAFPYDGGGVGVIFGTVGEGEEAEMWRRRWIALSAGQQTRPYLSVISLNTRGSINAVDDSFCSLSGFKRDNLVGRSFTEMMQAHEVHAFLKALNAAVINERPQEAVVTLVTRDDADSLLDLRLSAVSNDTIAEEIVVSIVDLTQLKALEVARSND